MELVSVQGNNSPIL